MRETIADVISVPVRALASLGALIRRSAIAQIAAVAAVAVVVVGLVVVALPANSVHHAAKFDPTAPSALATDLAGEYPLDKPVTIPFNKPMDAASVAASLSVNPASPFAMAWDEAGEILSLSPQRFWAPSATYTIEIGADAHDRQGLPLGQAVHVSFATASLTSGSISATEMVGKLLSPTTSFQITFTRPVKLATVVARFAIAPVVQGTLTGDDPTDAASQVFTFTPNEPLRAGTEYTASFQSTNAMDSMGLAITAVAPLKGVTVIGPAVLRFRPRDRATAVSPSQIISVRFTMAMDPVTTQAAFSIKVNGRKVAGKMYWSEHNTVLAMKPSKAFPVGATVVATVAGSAAAANGMKMARSASATFHVIKPTKRKIPTGGGKSVGESPWSSTEHYVLRLINCTRTGGWVVSGGSCSSYGHNTLPRQSALVYDSGIAAKVARPFAKLMAERNVLNHYADGSPHYRMSRAGYTSTTTGENIGAPRSLTAGIVSEHMFFQNEYPCRCHHYLNIMYPRFHRVGVGVWVYRGRIRMVADFYI